VRFDRQQSARRSVRCPLRSVRNHGPHLARSRTLPDHQRSRHAEYPAAGEAEPRTRYSDRKLMAAGLFHGKSLFVIQTGVSKPKWGKSWRGSLKQVLFSADIPYRSLAGNCQFRPFVNKKRVLAVSNGISFEPHCSLQYIQQIPRRFDSPLKFVMGCAGLLWCCRSRRRPLQMILEV
jgi:hypothetical protein